MKKIFIFLFFLSQPSFAKIKALVTVADLHAIVSEVGGDDVNAILLCRGDQDPHAIEAKPSLIVQASNADAVFAIGLELEIGWLPNILAGSRNAKIAKGAPGYLEVGSLVEPIDVPTMRVTRAQGDIHPEGNPHVTLDPIRAGKIALVVAQKLGELDPAHKAQYDSRAQALRQRMEEKTKGWQERITKSGVKKVITYHKTLTYFFARFGLENPMILEPVPGVPPTAKHIMEVIDGAKAQGIRLVMIENFYDASLGQRIEKDVPGLRTVSAPVAVGSRKDLVKMDDLYEALVKGVEGH